MYVRDAEVSLSDIGVQYVLDSQNVAGRMDLCMCSSPSPSEDLDVLWTEGRTLGLCLPAEGAPVSCVWADSFPFSSPLRLRICS